MTFFFEIDNRTSIGITVTNDTVNLQIHNDTKKTPRTVTAYIGDDYNYGSENEVVFTKVKGEWRNKTTING